MKKWPMEEFVEWISITYAYHRTKNLRQFKCIKTGSYDDKVTGSKTEPSRVVFFDVFSKLKSLLTKYYKVYNDSQEIQK